MATTHSLRSTTLKTLNDDVTQPESNVQLLKPYLFVLLGSKAHDNNLLREIGEILETNQIDVCVIRKCAKFKEWFKLRQPKQKIILIVSDTLGKKAVAMCHDSKLITAIYIYSSRKMMSDQWTQQYPKVCNVNIDTNQLVTRILQDLTNSTANSTPKSHNQAQKRSNEYVDESTLESASRKRIKTQSGMNEYPKIKSCTWSVVVSLTSSQFVLVDLSRRLNTPASAMLQRLCSLIKDSILVYDHAALDDLDIPAGKITYLFVSSKFAATMTAKSDQPHTIFMLEDDRNKVDHLNRFDTDEDLIFQLGDEIYRCLRREAEDLLQAGEQTQAKKKQHMADCIHGELKDAYKRSFECGNMVKILTPCQNNTN